MNTSLQKPDDEIWKKFLEWNHDTQHKRNPIPVCKIPEFMR